MRLVLDRPREVLEIAYDAMLEVPSERALAAAHGVTKDWFVKRYIAGVVVGAEVNGELAGGMFFLNGLVHLAIIRKFHGRWIKLLPLLLEEGFRRFGPRLVARVGVDNQRARRFVEAFRCLPVSINEHFIDYLVDKEQLHYGWHR